jgi:hypothetical protein
MFKPIITKWPNQEAKVATMYTYTIQFGPACEQTQHVMLTDQCAQQLQQYIDKVHPKDQRGQGHEIDQSFFENTDGWND